MTTYAELFPAGDTGHAHPGSSLASAESLFPAHALSPLAYESGDPYVDGMHRVWPLIEYPLATPEASGDDQYLDAAVRELIGIVTMPGASLVNPHVMNARLLLATMPGFRARARAPERKITPDITDDAHRAVGQVLIEFMLTNKLEFMPQDDYLGRLSEITSMYALLCGRRFPFLGSPREEANEYWQDNHDHYLLEDGFKIPFSIKHIGVAQNNPLVIMLRMGLIAQEAAQEAELTVNKRRGAEINALAAVMCKHALGRVLEDKEAAFLIKSFKLIEKQLEDFRTAGDSVPYTELPDLLRRPELSITQEAAANQ